MTTIIALLIWPFALLAFLLFGVMFLLAVLIIPREYLHPFVRIMCWFMLLASGQILIIKRSVQDQGPGPYIYMFNHASMFDVFMVGAIVKHYITAVGAHQQFDYPVWGTMIRRYGIIPIIRTNVRRAIASLDKAEEAILDGVSFLISPEGTRTLDGNLQKFKKGAFHVAKNTGATIIPLAFFGAFRAKAKPEWRIRPGILRAHIGRPITADEYQDLSVEELRDYVWDRIQNLLMEKDR